MGFSASQARYLALVSRMSDIEYQGQQINQERTTLSNQVNDLYNSLLDLSVPTPPATSEYTKVLYTANIGAVRYTIDSVRPYGAEEYSVTMSYDEVSDYLRRGARYEFERNGDTYTESTTGRPLLNFAPLVGNEFSAADAERYRNAIRNYYPEYASLSDEELMNRFKVYFTEDETPRTPHFVRTDALTMADGASGWADSYDYLENGTFTAKRTFVPSQLTFDEQGFISQIGIRIDGGGIQFYDLSSSTVTDQEAYDAAFNEYEAAKYLYDKKQAEINAKTSIIQREDKNLELKLTRLDNERNAVNTEIEAVKKVIDDAIDKGFKTFSG